MRFITNDIEDLEERLSRSGDHLQMTLTSLMSLSMMDLRDRVEELFTAYTDGTHEESVISAALCKHQKVDEGEAMEQFENDLLGKNVHPDAVDMHTASIRQWLLDTIAEEECEAGPSMPRPTSHDVQLASTSIASRVPATADVPTGPRHLARHTSVSPIYIARHSETGLEDRYSVPTEEQSQASVALQHNERGMLDLLPPPSEGPSSRRSSATSHVSKSSTWHPAKDPDPDYVSKMLAKPFTIDPLKGAVDIEKSSFYFKRAFHQRDCVEKGYLTRHEVISMCKEAIAVSNVELSSQALTGLIHSGDQNRDGRVDRDEFVLIMHNLLEAVSSIAGEQTHAIFKDVSDAADLAAKREQEKPENLIAALPWGIKHTRGPPFYDEIEQTTVHEQPALLPLHSFTIMAQTVASRSVGVIDEASTRWWKALSQDLRQTFRAVLDSVREAALGFTIFFSKSDETSLSDLDEMMVASHVVRQEYPSSARQNTLDDLRDVQRKCHYLSRHIRDFVARLEHPDSHDFRLIGEPTWPSAQTLTTDLSRWRLARMETWAWLITEMRHEIWEAVSDTVTRSRRWYSQYIEPLDNNPKAASILSHSSRGSRQEDSSEEQNTLNTPRR